MSRRVRANVWGALVGVLMTAAVSATRGFGWPVEVSVGVATYLLVAVGYWAVSKPIVAVEPHDALPYDAEAMATLREEYVPAVLRRPLDHFEGEPDDTQVFDGRYFSLRRPKGKRRAPKAGVR